ncbi:Glycosyl transferase family 14 [Arabidopsis suecica]|uniref:Glycosyl transferase family 14 n=1 Tax=Arabidopsis suecica TaxID=45249 RepID=A0A8T2BU46_ARASU|nr:Glycosyl transferase family 14 [Arabidopsis suecica]
MKKSQETQEDSLQQESRYQLHQIFISKIFKSHRFFQALVLYTLLIGFGFGLGFILNVHIRNVSFNPQIFRLSTLSPSLSSSFSTPLQPQPEKVVSLKDTVVATDDGDDDEGQKGHSLVKPENVMHNMTEEELFLRASKIQEKTLKKTKKVAFMFLTRGKLPLAKLWERFFKGHEGLFSIYIHTSDPFYVDDDIPETSPLYRRRIPSKEVGWGMVSMVEAERRLLANALLDAGNHRFVLLSESDIPLFNFSTIYSYLTNSQHSYVDVYDLPGPAGRGRYNRRMSPVISRRNWRKGSQWFEIDREVALAVVSDKTYFPVFKKHCLSNCYSDEHYLATLVHVMFPGKNANRSLTWTDWSRRGPHPRTYTRGSVTGEFLGRVRNREQGCVYNGKKSDKCYLFARKFDSGSLDKLLYFAHRVMGF